MVWQRMKGDAAASSAANEFLRLQPQVASIVL